MTAALLRGDRVRIAGFGTFYRGTYQGKPRILFRQAAALDFLLNPHLYQSNPQEPDQA